MKSSECIVNPVTGDKLKVLRAGAGASLEDGYLEFTLPPGSNGSPLHFHSRIRERFEVVDGSLSMIAGDPRRPRVLEVGGSLVVEPGVLHRFWNPRTEPVTFRCQVSPPGDFETFILALYQLGREGQTGPAGLPRSPLQVAVLLDLADFHFPGVPVFVQRCLRGLLVAIARRTGAADKIVQLADRLR